MGTELRLFTGSPGSGKTYWCVKLLVEEILPYYTDLGVVANVPLFLRPEWQERCELLEFEEGWVPPGDDESERLEWMRKKVIIVDECQRVLTPKNVKVILGLIGLSRKVDCQWIFLTQSKDNLPKEFDDLCEIWVESHKGAELRDQCFGFRIGDWQNIVAKLTGRYCEFFQRTEMLKRNRRWYPANKIPYREWFDQSIGDLYDTKNGQNVSEDGGAVVVHDYQRFKWPVLLYLVARRNWHVMPMFVARNAAALVPLGLGLAGCWYAFGTSKSPGVKLVTPSERVKAEAEKPAVVAAASAPLVAPAGRPAVRRVLKWCLLLCLLCGCRGAGMNVPEGPVVGHVARAVALADPRVAAFGAGHSLDGLLSEAGVKANTGMHVDGPLVGREVLDAARGGGYSLQGDTLVPARKRVVAVPQELGKVDGATDVGGFPVKLVSEDEVDQWRDLGGVVHEAYRTEMLIVGVSSTVSREVSAIASGQGTLTVSQPAGVPFAGKLNVALALNGNVVQGREIARPVLTSSPGASADVHVGQRIPVRLTTSSVSNQTTTTIGSSIQYVQTGTQVTVAPTRVSATQVRLKGHVSISQQTATVDGVPSTSERTLSVDHLVVLDAWTVLGRLDAASVKTSRGWLAIGNLKASSDETFLVVGRCIQVHRDERLHTGQQVGPVESPKVQEVAGPDPKSVTPGPDRKPGPVKPAEIKRDAAAVVPGGKSVTGAAGPGAKP